MSISKAEFDLLLRIPKQFETPDPLELGHVRWARNIISPETKEVFQLNYYRGSIEIEKFTYNQSFRKSIVLGRYDSRGKHTNPDGRVFEGPHVHIYDENYGDKVAYEVSVIGLSGDPDLITACKAFLGYFSINDLPVVQVSLM